MKITFTFTINLAETSTDLFTPTDFNNTEVTTNVCMDSRAIATVFLYTTHHPSSPATVVNRRYGTNEAYVYSALEVLVNSYYCLDLLSQGHAESTRLWVQHGYHLVCCRNGNKRLGKCSSACFGRAVLLCRWRSIFVHHTTQPVRT